MNRSDFKAISENRIKEAEILLSNEQYSGAYYLSGYCLECALKSCIAKMTNQYDFPDKRRTQDAYSHNLEQLMKVAGLDRELKNKMRNADFAANWTTVKDWNEQSRYEIKTEVQARDLFESISNDTNGILLWIQNFW